jgi:ABC-type phosphate transport system auxiliary subunit
MILKVVLAIATLFALLGLVLMLAVRGLRKFVRSAWPHS